MVYWAEAFGHNCKGSTAMFPAFFHMALSFGLPFFCGVVIGLLARRRPNTPVMHVVWCVAGILVALGLGYVSFYVFGVMMTGDSVGGVSLAEVLGGFMWFVPFAVFIFGPPSVAGYVCGLYVPRRVGRVLR